MSKAVKFITICKNGLKPHCYKDFQNIPDNRFTFIYYGESMDTEGLDLLAVTNNAKG